MIQRARVLAGLSLAAFVLAADQLSKQWILHGLDLPSRGDVSVIPKLLDFAMVWNHGITFGLLQAGHGLGQILLACVAIAVVAGLFLWLRRAETLTTALALGAVAGGALGNVADRARFGMVVDFVHVHWAGFDPFPFVFNLGDSAIVLGVAALLLESMLPDAAARAAGLQRPPAERVNLRGRTHEDRDDEILPAAACRHRALRLRRRGAYLRPDPRHP